MNRNDSGLNFLIEKHKGSWADVMMDIGKNVRNPCKRMDLYLEILGEVIKDSSTVNILQREMKYARTEMKEYERNLEKMAITDELTGLYNKRFFNATLKKQSQG